MAKQIDPATAAINAAMATVYMPIAELVAAGVKARKAAEEGVQAAAGSTWDGFKSGVALGWERGETVEVASKSLILACAEAGVPQGTVNNYITLFRGVMKDGLTADEATRTELLSLSLADARKSYGSRTPRAKADTPASGGEGEGNTEGATPAAPATPAAELTPRQAMLSEVATLVALLSDADLTALRDSLVAAAAGEPEQEVKQAGKRRK